MVKLYSKHFILVVSTSTDTADQQCSSTSSKLKTPLSEGRSSSQLRRHFRHTPKGLLHGVQNRKLTTPFKTPLVVKRKPWTDPKKNRNRAEVKKLETSNVSFEQALDEYSWDTT